MKVLSVNVGMPREIEFRGKPVKTSIFKQPVNGRVTARRLNIDGDSQSDLVSHGGEQRAVMVYQAESYQYWSEQLKRDDLFYGQFGENLTVEGLADNVVCIGDRYAIGTAIFEVTQPRFTCYRVGISLGVPEMPALLVTHKRPGFYFRVIKEGEIGSGDLIEKIKDGDQQMTVAEIDALLCFKDHPVDKLKKALQITALSKGWQGSFRNLLDAALKGVTTGNAGLSSPSGTLAWTGFRPFVVQHTRMESEDVRSFELKAWDGSPAPAFLPGQHIAVRIHATGDGTAMTRMFSLCGPQNESVLRIAVKREANGAASIYMHDHVSNGDILGITAPRGSFTLREGTGPVVLLSAGVGVTPLLSMLYYLTLTGPGREIWWIHSCKNRINEAFRGEVKSIEMKTAATFHRVIIYSSPADDDLQGRDYDRKGHLDREQIRSLGIPADGDFYVCGPPLYITSVTGSLKELGIAMNKIKSELFGSDPEAGGKIPHAPPENTGEGPLVTFGKSKISFRWHPRFGSLLEAAEACDVPVRWSCRMGVCHSCETGLIDGQVTYFSDPPDPPASVNVLICCAVPLSAVELDL